MASEFKTVPRTLRSPRVLSLDAAAAQAEELSALANRIPASVSLTSVRLLRTRREHLISLLLKPRCVAPKPAAPPAPSSLSVVSLESLCLAT